MGDDTCLEIFEVTCFDLEDEICPGCHNYDWDCDCKDPNDPGEIEDQFFTGQAA